MLLGHVGETTQILLPTYNGQYGRVQGSLECLFLLLEVRVAELGGDFPGRAQKMLIKDIEKLRATHASLEAVVKQRDLILCHGRAPGLIIQPAWDGPHHQAIVRGSARRFG